MSDERATKTKVCKALKKEGIFHYCPLDQGRAGVPDVHACSKSGICCWIELKRLRSKTLSHPLTTIQSVFLRDINASGGYGVVLIETDDGWHWEKITEVGERKSFDWNPRKLEEFINELNSQDS